MVAVLLAVALSQGVVPTHAPATAVEIANAKRLAATPGLLAQYFESPTRVRFEPWVSSYQHAISADGTAMYFIGANAEGIYLVQRSLATGRLTLGPRVHVYGDLSTLPNEPNEIVVAWGAGGTPGFFAFGIIDLRDGRIKPFTLSAEQIPYEASAEPSSGTGSALPTQVQDADTLATGDMLVAPSGRFLAARRKALSADCYLPDYMVFDTGTMSLVHLFIPPQASPKQGIRHGDSVASTAAGCDDTWEAFWHEGDILRIYRFRPNGYKAMFEVARDSTGEWHSSGESPIKRVTEVQPSRSLSPGERRLVLSRGADGPAFEIDPTVLFPGEKSGLSVVYGPCCVVILRAMDQGTTDAKTVEAVILRWKDSPGAADNE
jgi:hypothetical protein